jgi:hypothetical protein
MKKILATILAFMYLTVSTGATIHLHYCMGKLISWDLSHQEKSKCSTCGMDKKDHKGCCKDEHKILQVDKDQKTTDLSFQFHAFSHDAIAANHVYLPFAPIFSPVIENPVSHGPPQSGAIPIFVLNCNFRI